MLDLEYGIRASELINPEEMSALRRLNAEMVQFWLDLGASEAEIHHENLLDCGWDSLQVGFFLVRRHARGFHPEIVEILSRGAETIRAAFLPHLHLLSIPAARYFRVCDLLSGNDIPRAIAQVKEGLEKSRKYSKKDDVPLSDFGISVREPIHIHPSFSYGLRQEGDKKFFAFEVDLDGNIDPFTWGRQLNEFKYQYALYRATLRGTHDETSRGLIQSFLVSGETPRLCRGGSRSLTFT